MKFLEALVPHRKTPTDEEIKERTRKTQNDIRVRLAALDEKISVPARKTYVGGVVDAKLRQSHGS